MRTHKRANQRGRFSLAKFFQQFKEGDSVALVRDLTFPLDYKKQVQGRTGKVIAKRGSAYEVEIKDINKPKRYLIKPIHLKKIETK